MLRLADANRSDVTRLLAEYGLDLRHADPGVRTALERRAPALTVGQKPPFIPGTWRRADTGRAGEVTTAEVRLDQQFPARGR